MQLKHVIRPAALFAAGSLASGANAAVSIAATEAGTPIYLFGSQTAQFTYDSDFQGSGTVGPGNTKYYLRSAPGTSNLSTNASPNSFSTFSNEVYLFYTDTDGRPFVDRNQAGIRVADDSGTIRYGTITVNTTTRRLTDIALFGVTDFYIGTTPQPGAVGDVPEPETWATAVLGLGMAGAALRRSRRRSGARQPALLAA